jgi:hypothetical protein
MSLPAAASSQLDKYNRGQLRDIIIIITIITCRGQAHAHWQAIPYLND